LKLGRWSRLSLAVLVASAARPASAASPADGGLAGFVEDTRGVPVAGALISLFGRGIGGTGLVALSDSAGRFVLPAVPAGSYTLRALGAGHLPAPARHITVLPNREANYTVSLTPVGDEKAAAVAEAKAQEEGKDEAPSLAELRWLLRHKRRSVLEARGPEAETEDGHAAAATPSRLLSSLIPDLAGTVEVMASPSEADGDGFDSSPSYSVLRLKGRIANAGQWSLGGLVAESENATWRMAAEFRFEPGGGHKLQAGSGYGTRFLRPFAPGARPSRGDNHGVGAAFFQDQWQVTDDLTTTFAGRFSYIGFLRDSNHFDPLVSVELRRDDNTRLSATIETRTLAPGGDLLTLSTLATAPSVAFAVIDGSLRPERSARVELSVDQTFGPTTLRAQTFYEDVHHQLANAYHGPRSARTLEISDGGDTTARGLGLSVARRFGGAVNGSVSYRFGHCWRGAAPTISSPAPFALMDEGDFHDLATRLETFIDGTGTRVVALYRLIHLSPESERAQRGPLTNHRFDVQLSQGLPFVGRLTRADWDLLVAVRNLFYETSEGAVLDELAVTNPPTRVLGGISVRF
jgi:TonB-dependent receptor-like protein/carboxypeptidase family protein